MSRRTVLMLISVAVSLLPASPVAAARVDGNISLVAQSGGNLSSYSWATYYDTLGRTHDIYIAGTHSIIGVDVLQWGSYTGSYAGTRQGPWGCGNTYEARNYAQAYPLGPEVDDHVAGGPWTAFTAAPPCSEASASEPAERCEQQYGAIECSPILINLDNGAFALSGGDDAVSFDINADGTTERITWTARGSRIAFLAIDRNANGVIDDGSELFGDSTRLHTGEKAPNGFVALNEFDANRDQRIDVADARWHDLLLWTDMNHDGISQSGELIAIAASDIVAIDTDHHWTGRRDRYGNLFRYESLVYLTRGERPVYDVFFHGVP